MWVRVLPKVQIWKLNCTAYNHVLKTCGRGRRGNYFSPRSVEPGRLTPNNSVRTNRNQSDRPTARPTSVRPTTRPTSVRPTAPTRSNPSVRPTAPTEVIHQEEVIKNYKHYLLF